MDDLLIEIDNIDYKATARNVKEFLDKKLPRILRIANASPASLASPVISDMPVASDGSVNQSEKKMVRYIAAREIINGVSHAFSHCSQTCKVFKIGKSLIQCIASVQRTTSLGTRHSTSSPTALRCRKGALICMYTNRTIIKCY